MRAVTVGRVAAVLVAVAAAIACRGRASAAPSCSITPPTFDFGSFDTLGAKIKINGTISITCSGGGSPTPLVTLGAGGSGDENNRAMACSSGSCLSSHPSDLLSYGLYTNSGDTTNWGSTAVSFGNCANTTCTKKVYGLIPKAVAGSTNDIAVGGYSDTIVITASY